MDALDAFSIRLAEAIAPDEIDSAPAIARLAACGDNTSQAAGPVFGGFGGLSNLLGHASLLQDVFSTIKANLPLLASVCSIGAHGAKLVGFLRQRMNARPAPPQAEAPAEAAGNPVPQHPAAIDPVLDVIESAVRVLQSHLRSRGHDDERARNLALQILVVLATEPDGGRAVLARLGHENG
jgi:hypothetical protein